MSVNFTLHSDLFENFQMLHVESSYEIIRFYETHEDAIQFIDLEQQFIMLCYYSNSLFAIEEYQKYLSFATDVLEMSIIENIRYVDGVDVYLHSLQQMVKAHLELQQLEQAISIAKQLLAIAPKQKTYQKLLRRVLMRKRPKWILQVFGAALWAAIAWTTLEIFQLMFLEAFYPAALPVVNFLQILAILSGLACLFTGFRAHQQHVEGTIQAILKSKR